MSNVAISAAFPSERHYEALKAKGFEGRIDVRDLWHWHAYDYGWRRVMLQTRDDNSPIDPKREWFDASLAAEAEIFYAKKFDRRAPNLSTSKAPPTPEQIAHVERCAQQIIANIAAFADRNRNTFGSAKVDLRDAIQRTHEALGVTATETGRDDGHEEAGGMG
jgi:hypothetical protein